RDPKSDIVMTDSRVSWQHGEMRAEADGWVIEDLGSTNGTFLGAQRLDRIEIRAECVVRLGNPDDGPVLRCVPQVAAAPAPAPAAAPPAPPGPAPPPERSAPRDYAPRHGAGAPPQNFQPPRDFQAPPPAAAPRPAPAQPAAAQPAAAAQAEMLPSVDRRPTARM